MGATAAGGGDHLKSALFMAIVYSLFLMLVMISSTRKAFGRY